MKVILFAAVSCLVLATAYGLKCYSCEGDSHVFGTGNCGDTFVADDKLVMTCNDTAKETFCRKEFTGAGGAYNRISRSCATQCEDHDYLVNEVACCMTDLCNGATYTEVKITTMVGAIFMAAIVKYIL